MRVFLPYFGAKYMRAPHYPAPRFQTIIEPFAGGAGYSVRFHSYKVILIDKSEYVAGVWDYLIRTPSHEILALPLLEPGTDVSELSLPQEAKWLIGFWINQGSAVPKRTVGGRASNQRAGSWNAYSRDRLANQVNQIRHWKIIHGDHREAPDIEATWFIDPPYQVQGRHYPHQIEDYAELAEWCRERKGQTMVCESEGAASFCDHGCWSLSSKNHRGALAECTTENRS